MNRVVNCLVRVPPAPLAFALLLLALVGLWVFHSLHLALPLCGMRLLTGLPCPTCGATRCLLAVLTLNVPQAFRWNPLVLISCLSIAAWFLIWLIDRVTSQNRAERLWKTIQQRPWPGILIGAVLVNWVYLLIALPR